MLSNRNKAPDAAASITAISNSLGALHGGGDSSSDSSHSDNGEQDDSGNDNGSGSGDGGDDDWDDRDDADDGDVEEEGEGDDLDLLIVSGEEEKEADEEENENEEEAEEGFGSGGGGDEDEEGCIQREEEVADPPVELLEPNAATRHKRRNKRTARGKGSSGERLYRSQCRDYARVEVWRMMKAPVAFFRPQFRSVMLRHIDETAHFGNGEAADTLAAAFLADNEQDWWESLQDKKNNVSNELRSWVEDDVFGEAVFNALVQLHGGWPLFSDAHEHGGGGFLGTQAEDPENATLPDAEARDILRVWLTDTLTAPGRPYMYRTDAVDVALVPRIQMVVGLLDDPRSNVHFWPWYETLARRSSQDRNCNDKEQVDDEKK